MVDRTEGEAGVSEEDAVQPPRAKSAVRLPAWLRLTR